MIWHPSISTLFPYTTLFRSASRSAIRKTVTRSESLNGRGKSGFSLAHFQSVESPIFSRSADGLGRSTVCMSQVPFLRTATRSEEHTSELQSRPHLVCRLLLE